MMHGSVLALFALLAGGDAQPAELVVDIQKVRNDRGTLHACLTSNPRYFPDCSADPSALRQSVPAGTHMLRFRGYAAGQYALTLFHDENNNQRLDTVLGVPREGFGFSRNPTIRFGAPRFQQVNIQLGPGYTRQAVRMQYLL